MSEEWKSTGPRVLQEISVAFEGDEAEELRKMVSYLIDRIVVSEEGKKIQITQFDAYHVTEPVAVLSIKQREKILSILRLCAPVSQVVEPLLQLHLLPEELGRIDEGVSATFGLQQDPARTDAIQKFGEQMLGHKGRATLKPAQETIHYSVANGPVLPNGVSIPLQRMNEVCRSDTRGVAFVEELAPMIENAVHMIAKHNPVNFCPRSPDATNGDTGVLSAGDRKDIHSFYAFLMAAHVIVSRMISNENRHILPEGSFSSAVAGNIEISVTERLLFSFIRQRFPALLKLLELDDEFDANVQKKMDVFTEITLVLRSAVPLLNKTEGYMGLLHAQMKSPANSLHAQVFNLGSLQLLCDQKNLPQHTKREDVLSDQLLRASPNIMFLASEEKYENSEDHGPRFSNVSLISEYPALTRGIRTLYETRSMPKEGPVRSLMTAVTFHRQDGPACLSLESVNNIDTLLQAEHPTALFVHGLENRTDHGRVYARRILKELGIDAVMDMGATVENIVVVERHEILMKGLEAETDLDCEPYTYAVLPKHAAEALDVLNKCVPLPTEELEFIRSFHGWIPNDPVMMIHSIEDRGDDAEEVAPTPEAPVVMPQPVLI